MLLAPVTLNANVFEVVVVFVHFVLQAVTICGFFKKLVIAVKRADQPEGYQD
jgi:hypothetical protein